MVATVTPSPPTVADLQVVAVVAVIVAAEPKAPRDDAVDVFLCFCVWHRGC